MATRQMIVRTRFRDIPWEEIDRACVPDDEPVDRGKWDRLRGTPVAIRTPPVPAAANFKCNGPFYQLAADEDSAVCLHLVDLGD